MRVARTLKNGSDKDKKGAKSKTKTERRAGPKKTPQYWISWENFLDPKMAKTKTSSKQFSHGLVRIAYALPLAASYAVLPAHATKLPSDLLNCLKAHYSDVKTQA